MKKILILVSKRGKNKEKFKTYLKGFFKNKVEVVLGIFSDLTFDIETNSTVVKLDGRDISDFDLVYFRNTSGFQPMAEGLAIYLESTKVKFFDKSFINGSYVGDKFSSLMRLAINGIPVVPSFVCWGGAIGKEKASIVKKFGFPVVAKEVRSQRMERVYLLNSLKDFDKLPKKMTSGSLTRYLFQKFINIGSEFRLLVLGKNVEIVHTKTVRNNSEFHIGYSDIKECPKFLNIKDVSPDMVRTAEKAAELLHLQVAGVDICKEKDSGNIFVFEVNRGPGIDYNSKISQEMFKISSFFASELSV